MRSDKLSNILANQISGEWGDEGDTIAVLRTTNFTNEGKLDLTDVVRRNVSREKITRKVLKVGDTIIEKSGGSPTQPVGRVVFFDADDQEYLCNNFTSILRPSKKVDSRFFFWFLFTNHLQKKTLNYQNKTTGIINLKLERYLEETKIPLPSLPVQRKIAAILDKADSLRQKDKQLHEYYNQLARSIFHDMFGDPVLNEKRWDKEKIGTLTKVATGSTPSRERESDFYGGPHPWVKTAEVSGEYIYDTSEKITDLAIELTNCKLFPSESILLAMYGQGKTRGNVGLLKISAATNQACAVIPPSKRINQLFLFEQLKNSYFNIRSLARGGNQENLNLKIVSDYRVLVPPKNLQDKFQLKIESLNKQRDLVRQQQISSEILFQSFLQRAFKGELVKGC